MSLSAGSADQAVESGFLGLDRGELEARGALLTAREIAGQPEMLRALLADCGEAIAEARGFVREAIADKDRDIVLTGAGSSGLIADVVARAATRHNGRLIRRVDTTELVENVGCHLAPDRPVLLVSIGRSGNSPESLAAVSAVERHCLDVRHLVLTCNADGGLAALARKSERIRAVVMPKADDEGFAMTGSFTAAALVAQLILGHGDEVAERETAEDASRDAAFVEDVAAAAESLLARSDAVAKIASNASPRIVFLGAGVQKPAAEECALKLLELTDGDLMAVSWSHLGFRHGPKTLIQKDTLVVGLIADAHPASAYGLDIVRELAGDGRARPLALVRDGVAPVDGVEMFPVAPEDWRHGDGGLTILQVIFGQMLGFFCSFQRGFRTDQPSRTREVNRVVQGVTIYE